MSHSITPFTDYVERQLHTFGAQAKSAIKDWSYHLGRKFDTLRYDILPDIVQQTKDISLAILRNYFFLLPGLAFTLGHYIDVGVSALVCGVALADRVFDNPEFRYGSSLFFGVSIGLNLSLRVIDFVSSPCSFATVGILLHTISLAKLILIGTEKNIQNGDKHNDIND